MSRRKSDPSKTVPIDKSFGKRLHQIRTEKNVSIQKLANDIGVLRNYISQLENGERVPSFDTLLSIVNSLNITADELLRDYYRGQLKASVRANLLQSKIEQLSEEQQKHIEEMLLLEIQYLLKN